MEEKTLLLPLNLAQNILNYIQNNPSPTMPLNVGMNIIMQIQALKTTEEEDKE